MMLRRICEYSLLCLMWAGCAQMGKVQPLQVYIDQNEYGFYLWYSGDSCTNRVSAFEKFSYEFKISKDSTKRDTTFRNLIDLARYVTYGDEEERMRCVMYLLEHDALLPFELSFSNKGGTFDTVLYQRIPQFPSKWKMPNITGTCAPLISTLDVADVRKKVKEWAFANDKHLSAEQVEQAVGLYTWLSGDFAGERLKTSGDVPIVPSLRGLKYRVNADMKADHYILYGCANSDSEIKQFVGDVIKEDFKDCVGSLKEPMVCHTDTTACGYICICLIGINDDWTYEVYPMALVGLDSEAPQSKRWSFPVAKKLNIAIGTGYDVMLPTLEQERLFSGYADVKLTDWRGNSNVVNCTFSIDFYGDVDYVLIHREGSLSNYWLKPDVLKIVLPEDLSGEIYITYKLHFDDGNNIIPITIVDKAGNETHYTLMEEAKFEYK